MIARRSRDRVLARLRWSLTARDYRFDDATLNRYDTRALARPLDAGSNTQVAVDRVKVDTGACHLSCEVRTTDNFP